MNLFRHILSAALLAGSSAVACAAVVEATPGSLASQVSPDETSLTVTGSIDASDFDVIRNLRNLRTLDLSGATVASYSGDRLETGIMTSGADILPEAALLSVPATTVKLPAGIVAIQAGALGNIGAREIEIPSTVKTIEAGAFSALPALERITVPASVTSLGDRMFKDCPMLSEVTILADITELPASTFLNCKALTDVQLPEGLKSIGESAFAGCVALKSIEMPASLVAIGDLAFAGAGLESLDLSNHSSLAAIGEWAFSNCNDLLDVAVGSSVVSMGRGAFALNSQLASEVTAMAGNVKSLPSHFVYGSTLTGVNHLENLALDSIGDYALSGNLATAVTLPATVSHIGSGAMERMPNLTSLDASSIKAVPSLGKDVWAETDQPAAVCYVSPELFDTYSNSPQWREFQLQKKDPSAVDDTHITDVADGVTVRGVFDGMVLRLECDTEIRQVQLYDVSGRVLTIHRAAPARTMAIDTAPFDSRVFLVRLLLGDSSTPVLKLVRP